MIDLKPAADQVCRLTGNVSPDDFDKATPCADWTVRDLVGHLIGLTEAFTDAAEKRAAQTTPEAAAEDLVDSGGAWRSRLLQRLDELVTAWRQPDAWLGEAHAGGVTMPADQMGVVVVDELVLHGWDLARSTGQTFSVDPDHADAVLGFVNAMADPDQSGSREGLFGPVRDVPTDASTLERALALSGRNPDWSP